MRYLLLSLLTIGLGVVVSQQVYAENMTIEVITSDSYSLTGMDALKKKGMTVKLYNIDDGKRMVSQLEADLPKGEKAANEMMAQRIKKIGRATLQNMFQDAHQAVIIGTRYELTHYPAVVFEEGQSVVYGVTDLPRAVAIYSQWKVSK